MTIEEILELNKSIQSIKKIDVFLSNQNKTDLLYFKALCYKADILFEIGKINEAYKLLIQYNNQFSSMDEKCVIELCNEIIKISINSKMLDLSKKYIEIKKNYLKSYDTSIYIKDLILYYEAKNEKSEAKRNILIFLNDNIDDDDRLFAYELLLKYYYLEHDYENFFDIMNKLEFMYQRDFKFEKITDLYIKKISIIYESGNYNKTILDAKKLLDEANLNGDQEIILANYLLKAYLKTQEYKKAMIAESNYEEKLNNVNNKNKLDFCRSALMLYEHLNNKVSIKTYQDRIIEIENLEKEVKNEKKREKTPKIDLNFANEIDEPIIIEHKKIVKETKNLYISQMYEKVAIIFDELNNYSSKVLFREVFRKSMINLESIFPIKEVIIVYYNNDYYGYHYKKERVYDKKFNIEDLENTIHLLSFTEEEEIVTDNIKEESYNKDIITKNLFDQDYKAFTLPIERDNLVFGTITFLSEERFIDLDLAYESLKIISKMLNVRLNEELNKKSIELIHQKIFFITENMSSGVKEEIDGFIHLNDKAASILNLDNDIYISDYLSKIKEEDINSYKKIKEEILTKMTLETVIKYEFLVNNSYISIQERFYPMYEEGIIRILSLIDDITESEKTKNDLKKLAYQNPLTKLDTKLKLFIDLNSILEERKFSLCIIDINDFKRFGDLYGFNFQSQILFSVGKILTQMLVVEFNSSVYHIDGDKFAILFNNLNDKRLITSKMEKILDDLVLKLYDLNKRLKMSFSCGIFRYTKNLVINDPDKILFYASEALIDAKVVKNMKNHVAIFDQNTYKKRYFESQLITHISECIDHNKMIITYRQLVNFAENNVYAYVSKLNLINYDVEQDLIEEVICKRGLEELLDKYLFQNTLKELNLLYDEIHSYVKIIIPMHFKTIQNEKIILFINEQLRFFKIPANLITIHLADFKYDKMNAHNLNKLIEFGISISSNNIEDIMLKCANMYFYDYQKYQENNIIYLSDITKTYNSLFVVDKIENKDEIKICQKYMCDLYYGDYFKKSIKMKNLIDSIKKA